MIQFIAAAAVGLGVYAASRLIAREMQRVGDYLDEHGAPDKKNAEVLPVRLEKDEITGRYRPVADQTDQDAASGNKAAGAAAGNAGRHQRPDLPD